MSMTLWNISEEQRRINAILEEADGELTPEIESALEVNQENLLSKCENYAATALMYAATSLAIDEEIKRLQRLKKTASRIQESLKGRVVDAMKIFGHDRLDLGNYKLSFRKSTAVSIDDPELVPPQYQVQKIDYNKTAHQRWA